MMRYGESKKEPCILRRMPVKGAHGESIVFGFTKKGGSFCCGLSLLFVWAFRSRIIRLSVAGMMPRLFDSALFVTANV